MAACVTAAHAQAPTAETGGELESETKGPLWEFGLGLASLRVPDYRGSDQTRTYALPLPYIVYRGTWLRADRDGARALLLESDRVKVEVSVAGSVPTHSGDNDARQGMADLAPTIEVGPNAIVRLLESDDSRVRLDLRLPLRAAIAIQRSPRVIGATFSPNLNLDFPSFGGGWRAGLLAGPIFGNRRYHSYYYGVEAADATATRPAYQPPGGYAGWQALAATSRRIGRLWIGAFARYDSLRGAVFESSPLVRRDSGVTVGLGASWVFAASSRIVDAEDRGDR